MKFTKMHGCGNDYIYVNCFIEKVSNPGELAIKISDRHFGVGSDGLILIKPSESGRADAFMQLYNADGSAGTMCGNGIRCTAKYVYDHGIISPDKRQALIDTPAGVKNIDLTVENGKVIKARVDMGKAKITSELPEDILVHGMKLKFIGAYTGTEHAVYFLEDNPDLKEKDFMKMPDSDFAAEGVFFENHSRFPNRVNTEFIEIISRDEINMRVYERGSGETLACGTGATGAAFAGFTAGKLNREVLVHLRGGDLVINIEPDNTCFMTGPAVEVFSGEY
ncbi:MAG: diaminopimelate epimerase [Synergistaceae bacterium]|nr:diaminopimelate epimerase [Synergistaceae bacterium]MBR0204900.1 diaminopimelate epimerase [Synergistaceae bacterium]